MILVENRLILQPIESNRQYLQTVSLVEKLSPTPSKESLDALIKQSIHIGLMGNVAVEAFATHLRCPNKRIKYTWSTWEIGAEDSLSSLPGVALDRIFKQLPLKFACA